MTEIDELLDAIFSGTNRALFRDFERWVRNSRRFMAFASSYRTKIRAKVRNARDEAGIQDLRAELETALILLLEERFTVEYEMYAATKQRGPDFTVTFKTHIPFNVEVRRLRVGDLDALSDDARITKLIAVLCDKVAQMPPSIVNLLWLVSNREIPEDDLSGASAVLRQLAERKADSFFAHSGYPSASEFLKQYQRLSGIVTRQSVGHAVWLNPLARHKAPAGLVPAIQRLDSVWGQ
jgi:hypothetical protein